MQTIFLVEDDENIRELVLYALSSAGFAARGFESGETFWAFLSEETPDLILLDIMLPGDDGLSLLSKLKKGKSTAGVPVIFLTAKTSEYDRVRGLDLGADDFITKPFSVLELISRVKAVLRRTRVTECKSLTVGGIAIQPEKRIVLCDGEPVRLTYKEYELLHYMMENEGLVLSRDRIMEQVWGFDYEGESRTVDMHIRSLRRKLGQPGEAMIQTVRGVGYKIERST